MSTHVLRKGRVFQVRGDNLQRPSHCVHEARHGHLQAGGGEDAWWAEAAGGLRARAEGRGEGGPHVRGHGEAGGAELEGGSRPGGAPAPED